MKNRILIICASDATAAVILLPALRALAAGGYEVHIACPAGDHFGTLDQAGFRMHPVDLRRKLAPWSHLRALIQLRTVIAHGCFAIVNAHSPIGAMVGRTAARLAGDSAIAYTVHGFYFHEKMNPALRTVFRALEWILGGITDYFLFVSAEDHRTAMETGIIRKHARAITLFNGVNTALYSPAKTCPERVRLIRQRLNLAEGTPVIGIVARIVREKGYEEFLEMARLLAASSKATFLVVGDNLSSDRDQFGPVFRHKVEEAELTARFRFTGLTTDVADYLKVMTIFVLPSYREGFPVSVLEAMSTGLPVIATNIRGCREAVVHELTGLLVPPRDANALTNAVRRLLENEDEAREMGRAGRARVCSEFDQEKISARIVDFMDRIMRERAHT